MNNKQPCGAVQYDVSDYDQQFFVQFTIEVAKSLHMNLTVVTFDSIYTGSLDLSCTSLGMYISEISGNSSTSSRILVCVGDAIYRTIIYSHKVEFIIKNVVADSKLHVAFLYQAVLWPMLTNVMAKNIMAQSKLQEFELDSTGSLRSFHQHFKLSTIYIGATYDKQISLNASVNRHCTDSIAATRLFDGPILRYDVMLCKTNNSIVSKDMVEFFSYLGTYDITITYLRDRSHTNVHYYIDYKMLEIKAIDVNLALHEKYILNINTKHTDIYHQQWLIRSPYSIKLTMLENRRFVGYTRDCKFGAFQLKEITKYNFEREFGPFCTSDFGIPLMDEKSWYIGQRWARFTIWAFRGYFDMDIDIAIELTKCEGVNDVHSYLPCR